jgi:hypothetical protein
MKRLFLRSMFHLRSDSTKCYYIWYWKLLDNIKCCFAPDNLFCMTLRLNFFIFSKTAQHARNFYMMEIPLRWTAFLVYLYSDYPSIHPSISLPACLSVCPFVRSSIHPSSSSCCSYLERRASVKRFVSLQFRNLKTVGRKESLDGDEHDARHLPTQTQK